MKIAAHCLFLMLVVQSQLYAQDFSHSKNPTDIKREIEQKHASTKSLQADFNEEVSSVMFAEPQKGSGALYYQKEDKIRWETFSPKKQVILVNGNSVKLSEDGKAVSNPGSTKVVKKIQGMMLSMLSGEFLNEDDFSISYYENKNLYKLVLRPKNPRMSRYVVQIDLIFNRQTLLLSKMIMRESKEQQLMYTFSNIKTNETISSQRFNQF